MLPYLLIAPLFLFLAVFVFRPVVTSLLISLTDWSLGAKRSSFIGFANFARLYTDPTFWNAFGNTAVFAVSVTCGSIALGFGCAIATHGMRRRMQGFWQAVFFLPVAATLAAMSIVWKLMFHTNIGLLNALSTSLGGPAIAWLDHGNTAMIAVITVGIWSNFGYAMILFLAGLTAIPEEVIDAAKLDGAGPIARLVHVIVPLLAPTTLFVVVIITSRAIETFDSVLVLTDGGPLGRTQVLSHLLYQEAFVHLDAGYASAIAVTLFGVLFALASVQLAALGRGHAR